MRGRINVTEETIREKLGGTRGAYSHADVVAAVRPALAKSDEYTDLGGTADTIGGDVRRALASLREQGYASSKGVTAMMRWTVYARRRAA